MGHKIKILTTLYLLAGLSTLNASKRVIFVHGLNDPHIIWSQLHTITPMIGDGVFDDAEEFKYYPSEYSIKRAPGNLAKEINNLNRDGDEWVIIGHSLGGLIARRAHQLILNYYPNIILSGVLTITSPHQGSPATHTDENNSKKVANDYLDLVNKGFEAGLSENATWLQIIDYAFSGFDPKEGIPIAADAFIFRVKTSWHNMKSCKFHNSNEKQVC